MKINRAGKQPRVVGYCWACLLPLLAFHDGTDERTRHKEANHRVEDRRVED